MKKTASKSYDLTEARYIIMQELEYNFRDNLYLYKDNILKLASVEEERHGINVDIMSIRFTFLSLNGEKKFTNTIAVNSQMISSCYYPEDISKIIVLKIQKDGFKKLEDSIVNTEAFQTLYL